MRIERTDTLTNALLLVALLAGPLAWTAQLVAGYEIGDAGCSEAGSRWGVDTQAGAAAITAVTAAATIGGLTLSAWLCRRTREGGERMAFMACGGILVGAVFLVLILLGGIGSLSIPHCHQS